MNDITKTIAANKSNVSLLIHDLLAKQESAWKCKAESWPIESAITDLAEISTNDQHLVVLDLIFHEVVLRERLGQNPTLEEYQKRFPFLHDDLQMQWQMDELLGRMHDRSAGGTTVEELHHEGRFAISLPNRIDRYDIIQEIGRGAVGIVYEAFDPELKRTVALKRLKAGVDATREELARMQAESEAVAKIHHPHVVQVFDIGIDSGQPFMTMELCRGGSLGNRLRGNPIPPRQAAELAIQISHALEAAHQARIIHRDLKPDNIMLMEKTGWDVKITDFGLAKLMDSDSNATASGCLLGTPSYMAPEQAFGKGKSAGPAADVYAIGAILYECISGSPPFRGVSFAETIDLVCHREPVSLRHLAPGSPVDLETIAHKCLQKDPSKRYASAKELGNDLERFLAYKPILARKVSSRERLWRLCRRNPIASCLTAAVVLLVLGSIIGLTRLNSIIRKQEQEKSIALVEKTLAYNQKVTAMGDLEKANGVALKSTLLANRRFYAAQLNLANEALLQGRTARAVLLLESVLPKNGENDFRGFEWFKLRNELNRNLLFDVDVQNQEVRCLATSPDHKLWLVAGGDRYSGFYYILDSETGKVVKENRKLSCIVNGCVFDEKRNQFALTQGNGYLTFFDSKTFIRGTPERTPTQYKSFTISPDSRWIVGGGEDGDLRVIDRETNKIQMISKAHQSPVHFLFFSSDSKSLFSASEWGNEGKISRRWSFDSWPPTQVQEYPGIVLHDISSDSQTLVGTDWGELSTVSANNGAKIQTQVITSGPIARALYLNANQLLVATRTDNEIKRINLHDLNVIESYPMRHPVMCLALDRKNGRWSSGDSHGKLRIWNTREEMDSTPLDIPDAKIGRFLQDGKRILFGCADGPSQLWDSATGKTQEVPSRDHLCEWSRDGRVQICIGDFSDSKTRIDVWTDTGSEPRSIFFQGEIYRNCLELSDSGRWLTLRSEGNSSCLYDLQLPELTPALQVPGMAYRVAISPDDRYCFTAQQSGVVGCFDLLTGEAQPNLKEWESYWAWGMSFAFSSDGKLVASGNESGVIRVWEIGSRKVIYQLSTGQGEIVALDFFPDNHRLAVGGSHCVLICDIETGQELIRLPTLDTQVKYVDVNDQGTAVVAITDGGHIHHWDGAR